MTNSLLKSRDNTLLSWAYTGFFIFISAFLLAPSRDAVQIVFLFAFFIPMLFILLCRKPNLQNYGGRPTLLALSYAAYAAMSSLWGSPKDFLFFVLQWLVLASWLCGASWLFTQRNIAVQKYLCGLVMLGGVIAASVCFYNVFMLNASLNISLNPQQRWSGWNVFRNPNEIGALCGIIALLSLTLALQSASLLKAWRFYLCTSIALIGLLMSFSRGSLLAFMVMALVAYFTVRPRLNIWLPPLLIAGMLLAYLLLTTNLLGGFTQGHGQGLGARADVWQTVIARCRDNVMFGIGMAKNGSIIISGVDVFSHAHNAWLDTLYRTGAIGLLLSLLYLKSLLPLFSRQLLPFYLWLGYGCLWSLFDSHCFFWQIDAKWFFFWVPAGLIVAIHRGSSVCRDPLAVRE
jgi:hypothetical protein